MISGCKKISCFAINIVHAASDNLTIPNTFSDGEVVSASIFNANFEAVKNKVNKLNLGNRFKWIDQYVSDELADKYLAASDLVVLPYKSASQSGVIPLSYSYERPVIASDIKGIKEMIQTQKTGFLFEKDNPEALSKSIVNFFDKEEDYSSNIVECRKQFSWSYFIDEIINLYKRL